MALSPTDLKQQISPVGQSAASSQVIGVVVSPPPSRELGGQLASVVKVSRRPAASPRISQQALLVVTCWLTPSQRTVGRLQLPLIQSWWLPAAPQGVRLSALRSAGQSAVVLHWFTARHIADVRVWVTLQGPPLQVTSLHRVSSAGATQAPVPCWQVAQTPEQGPAQQNPPVQMPLWHWLAVMQAPPLPVSSGVQAPFVHWPVPPPCSMQLPPLVPVGVEHWSAAGPAQTPGFTQLRFVCSGREDWHCPALHWVCPQRASVAGILQVARPLLHADSHAPLHWLLQQTPDAVQTSPVWQGRAPQSWPGPTPGSTHCPCALQSPATPEPSEHDALGSAWHSPVACWQRWQAPHVPEQHTLLTQLLFWQSAPVVQRAPTAPRWSMQAEPSAAHNELSSQATAQHFLPPPTASSQALLAQFGLSEQVWPRPLRHWPLTSVWLGGQTQSPLVLQTFPWAEQFASQQRLTFVLSIRHCPGAAHCCGNAQAAPIGRSGLQVAVWVLQPLPQRDAALASHSTQRCPSLLHVVAPSQLTAQQRCPPATAPSQLLDAHWLLLVHCSRRLVRQSPRAPTHSLLPLQALSRCPGASATHAPVPAWHCSQAPPHASWQQTPSTHWPDSHSEAWLQASPARNRHASPSASWFGRHTQLPLSAQILPSAAQSRAQQRCRPLPSAWHVRPVKQPEATSHATPRPGSRLQPSPGVQPNGQSVCAKRPSAWQRSSSEPSQETWEPEHSTHPEPSLAQDNPSAHRSAQHTRVSPPSTGTHAPEAQSTSLVQAPPRSSVQFPCASQLQSVAGRSSVYGQSVAVAHAPKPWQAAVSSTS
jgi:hypothetical protein